MGPSSKKVKTYGYSSAQFNSVPDFHQRRVPTVDQKSRKFEHCSRFHNLRGEGRAAGRKKLTTYLHRQ
jgi:hypothetical protein